MDGSMVSNMSDFSPQIKRQRMTPPLNERVMLYVRQDNEDVYTPLHVVPPSTVGLLNAVSWQSCAVPTLNNTKTLENQNTFPDFQTKPHPICIYYSKKKSNLLLRYLQLGVDCNRKFDWIQKKSLERDWTVVKTHHFWQLSIHFLDHIEIDNKIGNICANNQFLINPLYVSV